MASSGTRTKLFQRMRPPSGSPPDAFSAHQNAVEPHLRLMCYRVGDVQERDLTIAEATALSADDARLWIDVQGLGDGSVVRSLGEAFHVHRLAQSDIVNLGQRPKADDYPEQDVLLIVLRMLSMDASGQLHHEQVSIVKGEDVVLTFQERRGDCLDALRDRIRNQRPNLMQNGSDYLAVQVLDAIVDGYFPILEQLGAQLESLEDRVLARPRPGQLQQAHRIRRDLTAFRRAAWPLREAISRLQREGDAIGEEAKLYLRDVVDHIYQVVDVLETYREIASGLVEVYLSMMGHRTNEVMRVLTVISSIFIPLTFLAGIYGMNFDPAVPGNMPELRWPYAYAIFWVVTLSAAVALLIVFRRLGWLGGPDRR